MCASPVNGIASSMVIRLKVPTEMHYAVIPMGTSKVNSSPACRKRFILQHLVSCRKSLKMELFNDLMANLTSYSAAR